MSGVLENLNRRFDYAALKADVDEQTIVKICREALKYDIFAVCVNPVWVKKAHEMVAGTKTKIVSTVGFPLGAYLTEIKTAEAARAVKDGATEIDMVANFGWIKSGELKKVAGEIAEIRKSIPFNVILKVIIEAPLLDLKQQIESTKVVIDGGAQFVKTGTGFSGDATIEQVRTLAKAAAGKIEIKASGGIRTLAQCRQFLEAGASRLGSSSCVAIMDELNRQIPA